MSRDLTTGPDDLQELARRGRWLLQTAIAEVALREQSGCRSRQLSAPEIRQGRNCRRRGPIERATALRDCRRADAAPPGSRPH